MFSCDQSLARNPTKTLTLAASNVVVITAWTAAGGKLQFNSILANCGGTESRSCDRQLTISPPTVAARLRTPRSTDAGGAVVNRFPRYSPGRPCCRQRLFLLAGERACHLPVSSRLRRQSAHLLCGCPAASVPLPCFARVRPWRGMPSQRRRWMEIL